MTTTQLLALSAFEMMLPVVVGVDGVAVLFVPLPDGQTA